MYEQKVLNIEATGDTWINRHGDTMYELIYTIKSPDPADLPPDADGTIRIKANHKTPNGPFQVGQIVDFEITRESGPGHPHNGKASKPGQGNFQNSRPASQPSSQPAAQPSSNGYADRDKSIRDAVVYKEAAAFLRANPQAGMAKWVRTARALMEIVECADIPQDTPAPVAADSEIPF